MKLDLFFWEICYISSRKNAECCAFVKIKLSVFIISSSAGQIVALGHFVNQNIALCCIKHKHNLWR